MTDIIEIKGKKYRLTPIEDKKTQENTPKKVAGSILDDYGEKPSEKEAVPGVFDWKKRLDEKRAIQSKNTVLKTLPQQDGDLKKFGNLIIGEGLTQLL